MGMEEHLEELKSRKQELLDLEVGTKGRKKKLRKIRRKIRKVERKLGERPPVGEGSTGGGSKKKRAPAGRKRTNASEEELQELLGQCVEYFKENGLNEMEWDNVPDRMAPYGFSLLDLYEFDGEPGDLVEKFHARWETNPEWYILAQQGIVPLVLFGPTPKATV